MRISSGKARGISLKVPRGDATRPATDAARLAIFSSLGDFVEGANVLDIFAGTGSYGLEALSRGAKSATFIETDRHALDSLRSNIESVKKALGALDANVLPKDFFKCEANANSLPDLIFADPPYDMLHSRGAEIFAALSRFCSPDGIVIVEAPADFDMPEGASFELIKRLGKKSKGKPSQLMLRLKQEKENFSNEEV